MNFCLKQQKQRRKFFVIKKNIIILSFDDDLIMETDGVLAEINLEAFTECIGGQIEEVLKKNEKSHEVIFSSFLT